MTNKTVELISKADDHVLFQHLGLVARYYLGSASRYTVYESGINLVNFCYFKLFNLFNMVVTLVIDWLNRCFP